MPERRTTQFPVPERTTVREDTAEWFLPLRRPRATTCRGPETREPPARTPRARTCDGQPPPPPAARR